MAFGFILHHVPKHWVYETCQDREKIITTTLGPLKMDVGCHQSCASSVELYVDIGYKYKLDPKMSNYKKKLVRKKCEKDL